MLTNLGLVAFYGDEAIRALVALEMQISGNLVTPTMFGELYYNKPPLYNWILLAVFELTGRNDEFICRLVTVFFLLVYAGSVFYFFRKLYNADPAVTSFPQPPPVREGAAAHESHEKEPTNLLPRRESGGGKHSALIALYSALALITCGRILFWDSMLGLIDMCFSWVMFLLFMVIYTNGEKQAFGKLFAWAYFLAAIGYLLKGLPAVAFLGITLLTYFIWQKKTRLLFSRMHVAGGLIFIFFVGGYYFLYAQENSLSEILETVFHESAKRTFVEYGIGKTLLHLATFPFEMWYHFLPWTLLFICFLQKNILEKITENKFITWNLLVFTTTILPYWSSVEVYPRYLLMHVPLIFSALFYIYLKNKKENGWQAKTVEIIFLCAICLTIVLVLIPIKWEAAKSISFLVLKSTGPAITLAFLAYLFWKWKHQRMLVLALVLLTVRLAFDFFILPTRINVECSTEVRRTTQEAVDFAGETPVYIYKGSLGFQPLTGYYFTRKTGKILEITGQDEIGDSYYLVHPGNYNARIFKKHKTVKINWKCSDLWLMGKRSAPK